MNTKRSTTFLLHGFNVRDKGEDTIEIMRPQLREITKGSLISYRYGWLGLFGVMLKNKKIAKAIAGIQSAEMKENNIFAVAHSNGAAIIVEAARQGAKFDKVLLINPALKVKTVFPESIGEVIVVYTKHDKPTQTARVLDKIPLLCLFIPNAWGAMGKVGYKGKDPKVTNIDASSVLDGHSDLFENKNAFVRVLLAKALYRSVIPKALFTLK